MVKNYKYKFFKSNSKVVGVAGVSTVLALGCLCGCSSKKSDEFIDAPDIVIDSLEDDLSFEDESSNDSVVTTYENYLDFFKNSTTHTNVSTGAFGNKKKPDGREKNVVDGNQLTTNDIISKRSSDGEIIRDISGKNSVKETNVGLNTTLKSSMNTRVFTTKTTTVTESIVTEAEPETEVQTELQTETSETSSYTDYSIGDICHSLGAYYSYRSDLLDSITCAYKYEGSNVFVEYDAGYGSSAMGGECYFILYNLNSNFEFDENMLAGFYKKYSVESLMNYKTFIFNLNSIVDYFGGQIDYSKYTIDPNVGNFLNEAKQAYKNGTFDDFMVYNFVEGNVSQEVLNNPGAMAILYSYDKGKYINFDDIDNMLSENVNYLCSVAQGYSYTK